jgi:transcriptional regulator with XRE-family HTH domain
MSELALALGKIISRRREAIGLSQEAFADQVGIHRTYVSQLERGLKSPTIAVLLRLANALKVPASKLVAELENEINGIQAEGKN